jgi:hypothetical protein
MVAIEALRRNYADPSGAESVVDDPNRAFDDEFCCAAQRRFGSPTIW